MDIRVNGQRFVTEVPQNTKAIFVLRNDLGFRDVRQGCGTGHCGACTVLVDGKPLSTCDMPIWALEGKEVTTVKGLGSPQNPHPVQKALLDEQAGQCGYCLSGIMATASALLNSPDSPSEAEVRVALDRHLCRCGTHDRIIRAVMRAIRVGEEENK
jgi:nicotinate dehydrogenase subunit A